MAIVTRVEICALTGIDEKHISTNIERAKKGMSGLVMTEKGLFNTENPINKAFIQMRQSKQANKPKLIPEYKDEDDEDEDSEIPDYQVSTQKLQHLKTLKTEKEIEKLGIDISKKMGEVVPVSLIKGVLLQQNQSVLMAYKQSIDSILRIYSKVHELTTNEIADITGQLVTAINNASVEAANLTIKNLNNIINAYSENYGVGERKG